MRSLVMNLLEAGITNSNLPFDAESGNNRTFAGAVVAKDVATASTVVLKEEHG